MKLVKASKILHVIALLCCFLPAIIPDCSCGGPTKAELEQKEKAFQDSIIEAAKADSIKISLGDTVFVENKADTTIVDTTAMAANADTIKTDSTKVVSAADTSAVKNTEEKENIVQKALNRLVFPDRKNLSIIGYGVFGLEGSCPVLFLFMLIWALGLRFTSRNHKLIFIQTLIGFIALTMYMPNNLKDLMWGFWVVYALSLFNAILNWRIYFEAKKNKLTNVWGDL